MTSLMLIGMGGNNGSTLCATILANRYHIVWHTKAGVQQPNYIGSLLRASTVRLGLDPATGKMVRPMVPPPPLRLCAARLPSLRRMYPQVEGGVEAQARQAPPRAPVRGSIRDSSGKR